LKIVKLFFDTFPSRIVASPLSTRRAPGGSQQHGATPSRY
jgi:hypothetical protein